MTYPAPDVVPYDEWFDPNYKYDPDEEMDLTPSSVEPQVKRKLYMKKCIRLVHDKYNPFSALREYP